MEYSILLISKKNKTTPTKGSTYCEYQGYQTRPESGGPTGLTRNRIEIQFFKHREPGLLLIP